MKMYCPDCQKLRGDELYPHPSICSRACTATTAEVFFICSVSHVDYYCCKCLDKYDLKKMYGIKEFYFKRDACNACKANSLEPPVLVAALPPGD